MRQRDGRRRPVCHPVFALNQITPAATVDEGNNWVNLGYGPLWRSNASSYTAPNDVLPPLGDYEPVSGSPAINAGANNPVPLLVQAPDHDFFGRARARTVANPVDIGAVEFAAAGGAAASVSPGTLDFGFVLPGSPVTTRTLTLHNNSTATLTNISVTVTGANGAQFARSGGTCGSSLTGAAAGSSCTIIVAFTPNALGIQTGTVRITTTETGAVAGSPVALTADVATAPAVTVSPGSVDLRQHGDACSGGGRPQRRR